MSMAMSIYEKMMAAMFRLIMKRSGINYNNFFSVVLTKYTLNIFRQDPDQIMITVYDYDTYLIRCNDGVILPLG